MRNFKKFNVRLIIGVPLIFFGITILTANLTYYLTMYYVRNSFPLHTRFLLDSISFVRLKIWVLILASCSFACGFGLIYTIIHPIQKLIHRAENFNHYFNSNNLNKEGEIEYFYSIFDEVLNLLKTHLKEKEMRVAAPLLTRLKRADQLATLGFISDRIAHEFRNPLGCIHGFVELMKKETEDKDGKRVYLDTILKSIRSMNLLVEELIEFSRPCIDISDLRDINQILREAVQEVQKEYSHNGIKVRGEFQDDLPPVKTNPQKIHKAFLNILRNTLSLSKKGEEILVTSLGSTSGFISMGYITIHFSNTKSYISPEDIHSIFLPFSVIQRQKMGLGLSISQQIIAAHGGDIWVESDQNFGTTFIVELPIYRNLPIDTKKREMELQKENN